MNDDSQLLRIAGRPVARYVTRPALPARLSPRPYLHPVTTLAGTAVTELSPADHTHHLGVGVAVPDVEGHNFWGGRTYVRDQGPTELDNHGTQRHAGFQLRDPDGFVEELRWTAAGTELLRERRTVAAVALTDTAWALDFTFSLTNVTARGLSIGSPATNGRPGAAYGGFFWRARKEQDAPRVFTADAEGEEAVHARTADWLALAGAAGRSSSPGRPARPAVTRGSSAPPSTRASAPPWPMTSGWPSRRGRRSYAGSSPSSPTAPSTGAGPPRWSARR